MFKIFPGTFTHDGRKVPIKECKWKTQSTRDQNVINYWSQNFSNKIKFWGIPCGEDNGILVLDADVKNGGLKTLEKYHIPLTMSQTTLSGGKHYIFKYPKDGKIYGNRVAFDQGLDIRGEDGYIANYGLDNAPIADAPEWLIEAALNEKTKVNIEDAIVVAPEIAQKILDTACDNIRNAPPGESNNILNVEAYNVGQLLTTNSIDQEYAYAELFKAAKDRGKPDYETKATIESGFKGGSSRPLTCPFGNLEPVLTIPIVEEEQKRWTPTFFSSYDLGNTSKLRKPQIFKDWSTEDIQITTADGGTGKTTLKLYEAICLALGVDFLGFKNNGPGRTLYITGEDTKEKLGAMIGIILKQMDLYDNKEAVEKVRDSILVKKDSDLCIITKTKQGFITINYDALNKVMEAVEDLRPKMIVFDPISSFWGSESALNDMSRAVAKFMAALVERSNACVEVINHMGKQSSSQNDMSQFAGRGGTGLPSHSRVSKVLRPVFDDEFEELTGMGLGEDQSAIMCNVNKFSDGSPLYNKPFLIIRDGYLFTKMELVEQKVKEEQNKMSHQERIFTFVKGERREGRYPNKDVVIARFMDDVDSISKDRILRTLNNLCYNGHMGEKLKQIENPDIEAGGKVYIIMDMKGKEL